VWNFEVQGPSSRKKGEKVYRRNGQCYTDSAPCGDVPTSGRGQGRKIDSYQKAVG